jgi:phenylpyruvate tautomerase PptA (4-oxalocrotonate tautomerase family)
MLTPHKCRPLTIDSKSTQHQPTITINPKESLMPAIVIHVPKGAFPSDACNNLIKKINEVAARCEQIPNEPQKRALCWVLIHELDAGLLTCGGADVTRMALPCLAIVNVPAGVLDAKSRADYVAEMHAAFKAALPAQDKRQLITSVILNDVADGTWGANGMIWTLPHLAKTAGYVHLQHLVAQ